MYHIPNKSVIHNEYQQYYGAPAPIREPEINIQVNQTGTVPQGVTNPQPQALNATKGKAKKSESKKAKPKAASEEGESGKKGSTDTSSFTVEQRVVAAAWVHERYYTHSSITEIKKQFVKRFGRPAPAKNTLLGWEQKLFSSETVHDAPRAGRPAKRKLLVSDVCASLRSAPGLSMRARAAALHVPCSTLRAMLRRDLPGVRVAQPVKQKSAKAARGAPPAPPAPLAPAEEPLTLPRALATLRGDN